ncbi:MAG: hypothetical protein WC184_07275 [Acidimicrobiia bacterium]
MTNRRKLPSVFLVLAMALAFSACSSDDDNGDSGATGDDLANGTTELPEDPSSTLPPEQSTTTTSDAESSNGDSSNGDGCWVHLYDDDNFKETDDNFRLTEPGRYSDLSNLPGADKDWDDEADSIRVGDSATVTLWSKRDFQGNKLELGSGDEVADLDDEPESLELVCD